MRKISATLWAVMVSVAVHFIVLTAFALAEFSPSKFQGQSRLTPLAKINGVKKLIEAAPVIPRPKIKKPVQSRETEQVNRILSTGKIFENVKPVSHSVPIIAKASDSTGIFSHSPEIFPKGTELFGSRTDERKICYLVDCSGSMQGIFSRVKKELAESIQNLQQDRYFCIIFFGNQKLFEFGDGRLVRAAEKTKIAACSFINSIRPGGQTNAVAALERAAKIRDSGGDKASVVYFLTDGFELTEENTVEFSQNITGLLKTFLPTTKINTIGFWPQKNDNEVLKKIAKQTNGEYTHITDENM